MKKIPFNTIPALCILFLVFSATAIAFAGADAIKERMINRLPAINELKASGTIGENNMGYIEVLPGKSADLGLIQAENSDRDQVYQAIARKQNTTAELVGKRRAIQLRDLAAAGHMVQTPDGQWVRK